MARYFKIRNCYPCSQGIPFKIIDQLRNISGLLYLDKIAEKLLSELIISDMKKKLDPSQNANQKGVSIQHYLIKFIDKILTSIDTSSKSETCDVLATILDWKQVFPC